MNQVVFSTYFLMVSMIPIKSDQVLKQNINTNSSANTVALIAAQTMLIIDANDHGGITTDLARQTSAHL